MTRRQIEARAIALFTKHLTTGCRISMPKSRLEQALVALGYSEAEARLILIDCWDVAELNLMAEAA